MTDPTIKVKTERPDEAEIRELAAKMVEANKAKALAASVAATRAPPGALVGVPPAGAGGQMGILNFLTRKNGATTTEQRPPADADKKTPAPDEASWKGHFGWDMLGKCHIPYIYRSGEKYVAVRMVEIKLLNKYLNYLHADIYSCTCIRSYYITEIEARLLNEINNRHCDGQFGREPFTQKDLVVRLSDAYEFYNFLDVCYYKLLRGTTNSKDKCGFIRINKESVVPYTVRDNQKFVPLFYFEGETDNLKLKADQLKGWDLSYLKFCCKVQGIRNELFASETCSVISLTDIKSYFPPGTEFEEYWPNKVVDSQLLISAKGSVSGGGQWTRAPPAPPPGVVGVGVGAGAGVSLSTVSSQSNRGRRAGAQRHSPAAAAMQMPHAGGLSAAAVQALANGWNLPTTLTQAQTQQVLRLAQAQVAAQAQAQAAARYSTAAIAAAAAALPQHRSQHQRGVQFPNSAISMAMGQQAPPPLVRSTANTTTMNESTKAATTEVQTITSRKRKTTNAQRCREYRERKKLQNTMVQNITAERSDECSETDQLPAKKPKTDAERRKKYYEAQKLKKQKSKKIPKTNAERRKKYYEAQKLKKQKSKKIPKTNAERRKKYYEAQKLKKQKSKKIPKTDKQRSKEYYDRKKKFQGLNTLNHHSDVVPPQVTGSMNGHSTSHSADSRRRLTRIPDINITGNHTPYKVQKALVENMMVPCINTKPYQYTELLMTLPDLASHFFPRVSLTTCRAMLDALGLTLYRPNSTQLQVLQSAGKCKSAGENILALVQVRDVLQHMPQFKYMLRSGLPDEPTHAPRPAHAHAPPAHAALAHAHAHAPQAKRARAN